MFGLFAKNVESAINWLQYTIMVFLFGSGIYVNLRTANEFIRFLGHISPFRYTVEPMLRSLLSGLDYADLICEYYDFTFGEMAIPISLGIAVFLFILGWVVIVVKTGRM
jgi:hypothetical protein